MLTTIVNKKKVERMRFRVLAVAAALPLAACTQAPQVAGVVASTSVWADVASAVLVDVPVTAIVKDNAIDPHSFEATASDLATAMDAEMVIVGGGGYDAWLYEPLAGRSDATVIHALPLEGHEHGEHGEHGEHEGHEEHHHEANEHVWFDVDAVSDVAEEIAAHAEHADAGPVVADLDSIRQQLAALDGASVAQTETVADYLIEDSGLTDVTPAGYRSASLNHTAPAAGDLAAFLDAIDNGEVDVLIHNPQTETDLTASIRDAADKAGVPVVEIAEIPPAGTSFFDYFHRVVDELEKALKKEGA